MSEIRKKTWPELFEKVLSGEKGFELRVNDSCLVGRRVDVAKGGKKLIEEKGFHIIQFEK